MARFETPIGNRQVAEALAGLDIQSVMLARNPDHAARLREFTDQYVMPETLEHQMPDGNVYAYELPRLSAIGENGSLLHIRLHRQVVGQPVEPAFRHVAVISHVNDPHPATVLPAVSEDIVRFDASRETRFSIGRPDPDSLQLVESPMSQLEWDVETVVARELALRALPVVVVAGHGWEYRRSDRHWEKLSDIRYVHERVQIALSRGLGYAATAEDRAHDDSLGQFDEKMVV